MAANSVVASKVSRLGMHMLTQEMGLGALESILKQGRTLETGSLVSVVPFDWSRFSRTTKRPGFTFNEFITSNKAEVDTANKNGSSNSTRLETKVRHNSTNVVLEVEKIVEGIVGRHVNIDQPLMDAGIDSLGAVELQSTISSHFGFSVPSTLIFDYPTISAIGSYLLSAISKIMPKDGRFQNIEKQPKDHSTSSSTQPLDYYLSKVTEAVRDVIGSMIEVHQPLMAMGLDSLGSVELRNILEVQIGVKLPSTLAMDYPTIRSIALFIHSTLQDATMPSRSSFSSRRQALVNEKEHQNIHVIGCGQKIPRYVCAFTEGTDTIRTVPLARWDVEIVAENPPRFGSFLDDVGKFDAPAFGISSHEALFMDPQHQSVLESFFSARVAAFSKLKEADTLRFGVFLGISALDYSKLSSKLSVEITPYSATGSLSLSVAPGRISYTFGLQGPSLAVDTACSSSLVAINVASKNITTGSCKIAAAGGVNLTLIPDTSTLFQKAGMLAPDGRCKTLDSSANGYVRGEASGILVLSSEGFPGDEPIALIQGSAINQDGRSSSLTAPNGPSQQRAIRAALHDGGISSSNVSVISSHGTGTSLGDPIEMGALSAVFMEEGDSNHPLALSSSKSWLGHSEPASGIMGIFQGILCQAQRTASPIVHLKSVNTHVSSILDSYGSRSNWLLPKESSVFPRNKCCGVSAFAFQGTNAHVILKGLPLNNNVQKNIPRWRRAKLSLFPELHAFGVRSTRKAGSELVFSAHFLRSQSHFVWDHIINGKALLPATGFIEAGMGCINAAAHLSDVLPSLSNVVISTPLVLPSQPSWVAIDVSVDCAQGTLQLYTCGQKSVPHFNSKIALNNTIFKTPKVTKFDLSGWFPRDPNKAHIFSHPDYLVSGCLESQHTISGFQCHPAELDGGFQLGAGHTLLLEKSDDLRIPVGIGFYLPGSERFRILAASVTQTEDKTSPKSVFADYTLECTGKSHSLVRSLEAKKFRQSRVNQDLGSESANILYETQMQATEAHLLPGGDALELRCSASGSCPTRFASNALCGIQGLLHQEEVRDCLLTASDQTAHLHLDEIVSKMVKSATLEVSKTCMSTITASSFSKFGDGKFAYTKLDMSRQNTAISDEHSVGSVLHRQVLLQSRTAEGTESVHLVPEPRGSLTNLKPRKIAATKVSPNQMKVAVKAVGINFRDLLNILGMYPGDPGLPGGDCSGVVVACGELGSPRLGSRVFGLAGGCLGTHVYCSKDSMVEIPMNVSFEEAATIPTTFITVDLAFTKATVVSPQSRVLIHAATGGVGLAAIQMVRVLGGNASGTAGSSHKRYVAKKEGALCTLGSRDLMFVEEMSLYGGAHIVLNSLTSPGMLSASASILAEGGSLVEISKRDIWSATRFQQERPDVRFTVLAVDFLPSSVVKQSLLKISSLLAERSITPLPSTVHNMNSVVAALRQFSTARHVGKIVTVNHTPMVSGQALITGGAGSLGMMIANWLFSHGAKVVYLVGRSPRAGAARWLQSSSQTVYCTGTVHFLSVDVCSSSDILELRETLRSGIDLLLHASGTTKDCLIGKQTVQSLRAVFGPKLGFFQSIASFLGLFPTCQYVLFSSVASLMGSSGQINYSAANAGLDAWARSLGKQGFHCTSIQWGAWSGGGMADNSAAVVAKLDRLGLAMLEPARGLASLQGIMNVCASNVVAVVPFSWPKFMSRAENSKSYLFEEFKQLGHLAEGHIPSLGSKKPENGTTLSRSVILNKVQDSVSSVAGQIPDNDESLLSTGLDSLGSVELRNTLEKGLGIQLPSTLVFDYPSITAIVDFVCKQLDIGEKMPVKTVTPARSKDSPDNSVVAVIADVRRLPNGTYGTGLSFDAPSPVPLDRWNTEQPSCRVNEVMAKFGVFLHGIELFDNKAFGVPSTEALLMDPQQRLVLEGIWEAIPSNMKARETRSTSGWGVFVGVSSQDYGKLSARYIDQPTGYSATASALSVISGRAAYTFGFTGQAITVDTACSSSLVSMHAAFHGLKHQECDFAVNCGVNLTLTPDTPETFKTAGMLSVDGRCKTLDAAANGYVRAEGCVVHVLSRVTHRSGIESIGFVQSTAVNQDGRSSSLTAPNGPSQQVVIKNALAVGNCRPLDISAVSMHGTGTSLGDPIEIGALSAVHLDGRGDTEAILTVLSSKSWIGHSEPAAGAVGCAFGLSTALYKSIPLITHLSHTNPYVMDNMRVDGITSWWNLPRQFSGLPVDGNVKSYFGVSAFAFQGTNAHNILGSADDAPPSRVTAHPTWEKERHFIPVVQFPFLTCISRCTDATMFECNMVLPHLSFIRDHQVTGRCIFPAAGFMEVAAECAHTFVSTNPSVCLSSGVISAPLIFSQESSSSRIQCTVENNAHVKIGSVKNGTLITHMETLVSSFVSSSKDAHGRQLHDTISKLFRNLWAHLFFDKTSQSTLGTSALGSSKNSLKWKSDPCTLDCSFQLGAAVASWGRNGGRIGLKVPVGFKAMALPQAQDHTSGSDKAVVEVLELGPVNVQTLIESNPSCSVSGLEAKEIQAAPLRKLEKPVNQDCLYHSIWVANRIAIEPTLKKCEPSKIVCIAKTLSVVNSTLASLTLFKHMNEVEMDSVRPRIGFENSTQEQDAMSTSSAILGLSKSANLERGRQCIVSKMTSFSPQKAFAQISSRSKGQTAFRDSFGEQVKGGVQLSAVLKKSPQTTLPSQFHFVPEPRGSLTSLVPLAINSAQLSDHQVAIRVKSVGVNFRDVLNILGMYPGDPGPPGGDFAGIVTAACSKSAWQVGERVFGLSSGSLGTYTLTSDLNVVLIPTNITFEEAATIPTVFITVDMALNSVTTVRESDRVLIHAATGGVGLAALQMIRVLGAHPYATAGSSYKRALSRSLGTSSVDNSRDLMYIENLAVQGLVDIVLNSLTSPGFIAGSAALLKQGGDFVEISKRDIWSPYRMSIERPDVTQSTLAIDFLPPAAVQVSLKRISRMLGRGSLVALPGVVHRLSSVVPALRQMSQARHIGKIVISNRDAHEVGGSGGVLVTGGLGALGCVVTQWLAGCKVQHIILSARNAKKLPNSISCLSISGTCPQITIIQGDVSSTSDMKHVLKTYHAEDDLSVGTTFHTSGVLRDGMINQLSAIHMREVFSPKASAVQLLEMYTVHKPCTENILFSSVASLLGSAGQSNYSAANAVLDANAENFRSWGLPFLSVQWGAWAGSGMALLDKSTERRVQRLGMSMLMPGSGIDALAEAVSALKQSHSTWHCPAIVSAVPFVWDTIQNRYEESTIFFSDQVSQYGVPSTQHETVDGVSRDIDRSVKGSPMNFSNEILIQEIENLIENVIGHRVPMDEPLMAAGLDSLGATELRNSLSNRLGVNLSNTLVFDHPSIQAIAKHVQTLLQPSMEFERSANVPDESTRGKRNLFGITAATCRLPGREMLSVKSFDTSTPIPIERWDVDLQDNLLRESQVRFGSFLFGVEGFSPEVFGISDKEAIVMDPQQRLLLDSVAESMIDSHTKTHDYSGFGIFVGASSMDYSKLYSWQRGSFTAFNATSSALSVVSGRLSYTFGFKGPCATIETACSSSLVSLHMACMSLSFGHCRAAMNCGVNLTLTPDTPAMFVKAGMLARDGRCKTLDEDANGYCRAEAASTIAITQIEEDEIGSFIAVVSGTGVNQDGRSSNLTAPNGPSQQEVIRMALTSASIGPDNLHNISMHGTGTGLGDPIEIGALVGVFGQIRNKAPINLLSSKSSIGHSEPAAGMIGSHFATQTLNHQASMGIVHLRNVNPYVMNALNPSASMICKWRIPRQCGPLSHSDLGSRFSSISAFAFQGTNAEVIIQSRRDFGGTQLASVELFWNHRSFWIYPNTLFDMIRVSSHPATVVFEINLEMARHTSAFDHRVKGSAMFPAAGYVEILLMCTRSLSNDQRSPDISGITIATPCIVSPDSRAHLLCSLSLETFMMEVSSDHVHDRVHLSACITSVVAVHNRSILSRYAEGILPIIDQDLHQLTFKNQAKSANINNSTSGASTRFVCAATLDCSFQLGACDSVNGGDKDLKIPVQIGMIVSQSFGEEGSLFTWANIKRDSDRISVCDYSLRLPSGEVLSAVSDLQAKSFSGVKSRRKITSPENPKQDFLYDTVWLVDSPQKQFKITHCPRIELGSKAPSILATTALSLLKTLEEHEPLRACFDLHSVIDNSDVLVPDTYQASHGNVILGVVKSAAQELPNFQLGARNDCLSHSNVPHIDFGPVDKHQEPSGLNEWSHRCGVRAVAQMRRSYALSSSSPCQLIPKTRGSLHNLVPEVVSLQPNTLDDLVISVKSVGINFRDVLNILGMYPGDPGPPGGDCSGVVVANSGSLGPGIGESVFGLASGSFGTHVHCPVTNMVVMPANMSFEEAATTPTVFTTAHLAFRMAACITPKDKILVHAAAGGVGLASVQIALSEGATIYATAGSSFKRTLLRSLGVKHVFNSRDQYFIEDVQKLGGVDVVLNSLTSSGMVAGTCALLRRGGRFVEISKRDIWSKHSLSCDRPDIDFNTLAIDFLTGEVLHQSLLSLSSYLSQGKVRPLPGVIHGLPSIVAALRQMSQARHVGKIVISNPLKSRLHSNGRCIVSGGLGSLGMVIADWLAKMGLEYVELLGRSGRMASMDAVSLYSAQVILSKVDMGSSEDWYGVVMSPEKTPITSIFHASGILSDGTLRNQSLSGLRRVFASKVAALKIWEQSPMLASPQVEQVLFSSVASLLGSPGQINYSAANASLDEHAIKLMRTGQTCVSIQWGAWSGAGNVSLSYLTFNAKVDPPIQRCNN